MSRSGTKIVNITRGKGDQKAISIDRLLFDLFSIKSGGDREATKKIKEYALKNYQHLNSAYIRRILLLEIADRELRAAYLQR